MSRVNSSCPLTATFRARPPAHTPHWRLDPPGIQRNRAAMKETARMDKEHDLVVIGTGPGGEGAAMQAAKQGKSVVVGRTHAADRRRLHASGHDSQQVAAVRDLSDDRSEQQPAVPRSRPRGESRVPRLAEGGEVGHRPAGRNAPRVLRTQRRPGRVRTRQVRRPAHDRSRGRWRSAAARCGRRPSSSPPAPGRIARRTSISITRASSTATRSSNLDSIAARDHDLRRGRRRLRIRVDVSQPGMQGEPGQHAGQAARVPGRRDHRRAELPPARTRRPDPPQRSVREDRPAWTTASILH